MQVIETSSAIVGAGLDLLRSFWQRGTSPDQARQEVAELARSAPELTLDLVWEDECAGPEIHYDLLISDQRETVSLSFCEQGAIPWPLRGTQRWTDRHILRVNTELVDVEALMAKLDFVWGDTRLMERLVEERLIEQYVARHRLQLAPAECAKATEDFYHRRGIADPAVRQAWLASRGMSPDRLARHVEADALAAKVRGNACEGGEAGYFEQHRHSLEKLSVVEIRSDSLDDLTALQAEWVGLGHEAIVCRVQSLASEGVAKGCSMVFRRVRRAELQTLDDDTAAPVMPGATLGPYRTPGGHLLTFVLAAHPAVLDDETRRECRQALYAEWLARERGQASVEWFWGSRSVARAS